MVIIYHGKQVEWPQAGIIQIEILLEYLDDFARDLHIPLNISFDNVGVVVDGKKVYDFVNSVASPYSTVEIYRLGEKPSTITPKKKYRSIDD
jgi:hypothetical protein